MYKDLTGQNVLSVLLGDIEDKKRMRMFFCPYTKNRTAQYTGEVRAIMPGFNPLEGAQVMICPQRMEYGYNIKYAFHNTSQDTQSVDFYIQDHYFIEAPIKTYHCYNCQAPQLYYAGAKVVAYNTKKDIKRGETYTCMNPLCKTKLTYMGTVKIAEVTEENS